MKIDPYIVSMMSIIISYGKEHAKHTGKQADLVGLSKNHPKKHKKMHFFLKIAKEKELKLKISILTYMYKCYIQLRANCSFPSIWCAQATG